jgi:hypothetical protein
MEDDDDNDDDRREDQDLDDHDDDATTMDDRRTAADKPEIVVDIDRRFLCDDTTTLGRIIDISDNIL